MVKKAFTLSEVVISLAIIGIIAVISVPSVINNAGERKNKVKIQRALGVYESLIDTLRRENNFRSKSEINSMLNNANQNCSSYGNYIKIAEFDSANPCIFKTKDGLWWNAKFLGRTIISFKRANLTSYKGQTANSTDAFILTSELDSNGNLRTNDVGYAQSATLPVYEKYVKKVYDYLDDVEIESIGNNLPDKYQTACEKDRYSNILNPPCKLLKGTSVSIYKNCLAYNNYCTSVTLTGCTNNKNCTKSWFSEYIDLGNGNYRQYLSKNCDIRGNNCKISMVRDWHVGALNISNITKSQTGCTDFANCNCKINGSNCTDDQIDW